MYLLYPFLYKMILAFGAMKVNMMAILMISLSVVFLWIIHTIDVNYYNMTHIGFSKIPMFICGMCLGFHSFYNKSVGMGKIIILILLFLITYILKSKIPVLDDYSEMFLRIIGIIAICLFFNHFKNITHKIRSFFEWFGEYSLELYILHMQFYYFLIKPFLLQYTVCQTGTGNLIIAIMTIALSIALCKPIHKLCDRMAKTVIQK